jgi:bile acid:Na+ symporter, BASS family
MDLQQLIMLVLQASIFLTVFGYGLEATADDALYLVRRPAVLTRSFVAMFLIMPLIAVIVTAVYEFHSAVKIALVALAISPIPPLLPQRVVKAGGEGSYAIGLMATAAIVSIVFIPLAVRVIGWFFNEPFAIEPGAVARLALLTVVVPLAAGMAFRAIASTIADRIQKPVALIAIVLLGLGILAILVAALPAVLALVGNGPSS